MKPYVISQVPLVTTLDVYFEILRYCEWNTTISKRDIRELKKSMSREDIQSINEGVKRHARAAERLRRARVYDIAPELIISIFYAGLDAFESLFMDRYGDGPIELTPARRDAIRSEIGPLLPQIDDLILPFEVIFCGFGDGVSMSTPFRPDFMRIGVTEDEDALAIRGVLIDRSGHIDLIVGNSHFGESRNIQRNRVATLTSAMYYKEWRPGYLLDAFFVEFLLGVLNSYGSYIEGNVNVLMNGRQQAGRPTQFPPSVRPIPQDYYEVTLTSKVYKETEQRSSSRSSGNRYSYRHDVDGHERCKVYRGPSPIPKAILGRLERLKYEIFRKGDTVPVDYTIRLIKRDRPPKADDEWLAIKIIWVSEHKRGPAGAPYVPAIRVVPKMKVNK